jgi:hypothetical protein
VAREAAAGAVEDLLPPRCELVDADAGHPADDTGIPDVRTAWEEA